jgi:glucose/arabinose dehydrogenase
MLRSLLAGALLAGGAAAQTIPADLQLTSLGLSGLSQPLSIRHAGDGSNRLFVVEKTGSIKVIVNGVLQATPFLTIPVTTTGESGLLGLAFHPDFRNNGRFYVAYTRPPGWPGGFLGATADQAIAEFRVSAGNPNVADPATRREIIALPDPFANHNGGDIHFGPDGFLYWAMGDGGSGNDPNQFAQRLGRHTVGSFEYYLLGKIIRIDIDNSTPKPAANQCAARGQPANYAIPATNPFVNNPNACAEIWHYGLRNPWRFSFDRLTGRMWIGDVGQNAFEEIDRVEAGASGVNFGWRCREGFSATSNANNGLCAGITGLTDPVADYGRTTGQSVSGGYMYRGPITPLRGIYVYADYLSQRIFMHRPGDDGTRAPFEWTRNVNGSWVSFGEDEIGNLYIVDIAGGQVYRFDSPSTPPDSVFVNGFEG